MTDFAPPSSKADTENPKDRLGAQKASVSFVPQIAILQCARAMMWGGGRYGKHNWRAKKVIGSIYIDAGFRHRALWVEGQDYDPESGHHHLAHAMACDAILLDAIHTGNLIDDRPLVSPEQTLKVIDELTRVIRMTEGRQE